MAKACRQTGETPVLQRLGWMLQRFGCGKLAEEVLKELAHRRLENVPLEIGNHSPACPYWGWETRDRMD